MLRLHHEPGDTARRLSCGGDGTMLDGRNIRMFDYFTEFADDHIHAAPDVIVRRFSVLLKSARASLIGNRSWRGGRRHRTTDGLSQARDMRGTGGGRCANQRHAQLAVAGGLEPPTTGLTIGCPKRFCNLRPATWDSGFEPRVPLN